MDRLTYWNNKEKNSALPMAINDDGDTVDLETPCAKLAAYEDAEENGLLLRLLCKVGTTVHVVAKCAVVCMHHDNDYCFAPRAKNEIT